MFVVVALLTPLFQNALGGNTSRRVLYGIACQCLGLVDSLSPVGFADDAHGYNHTIWVVLVIVSPPCVPRVCIVLRGGVCSSALPDALALQVVGDFVIAHLRINHP